jgi:hypothetical protein
VEIERRTPRKRVAHVVIEVAAPNFEPSAAAWSEIERPYRRQFDNEQRDGLRAIVSKYFDWRRFEAAPFVTDKVAEIDEILAAARKMNRVLVHLMGAADKPNKAARLEAELAIEREWPGAGDRHLATVIGLSHALALACIKAKDKAANERGIKMGRAWNSMVIELRTFVRKCGLKASVNSK